MEPVPLCPGGNEPDLRFLLRGRRPPGPESLGSQRVLSTRLEWVPDRSNWEPIRPWSDERRSELHALRRVQRPSEQPFPEELGWWNIA